jgi:hypothetical protein
MVMGGSIYSGSQGANTFVKYLEFYFYGELIMAVMGLFVILLSFYKMRRKDLRVCLNMFADRHLRSLVIGFFF